MSQGEGIIQSIIFDATMWTVIDSANWVLHHGYKVTKIDQPHNFIRYRQVSPTTLRNKGYTQYHNKKIGDGIELVLAYKPRNGYDYM